MVFAAGPTELDFDLAKPGPPVETRPDLGIGTDDVRRSGRQISVRIHSLGARDAPAGALELVDAKGKVIVRAKTPPLKAPRDLKPKTAMVKLSLSAGVDAKGARVRIVLAQPEITQLNNSVALP